MYLRVCQQLCDPNDENYIGKNSSYNESCKVFGCLLKSIGALILGFVIISLIWGTLILFGMLGSAIVNSRNYDLSTGCPHGVDYYKKGKCKNGDDILFCTANLKENPLMLVACPISYGILTPIIIFFSSMLLVFLSWSIINPMYEFCISYNNLIKNQVKSENNEDNPQTLNTFEITSNVLDKSDSLSSSDSAHNSHSSQENDDVTINLVNSIN